MMSENANGSQLPADVRQSLGELISQESAEKKEGTVRLILGVIGMAAGAFFALSALISFAGLAFGGGDGGVGAGACMGFGLLVLGAIPAGLGFFAFRSYQKSSKRRALAVYENGLVKYVGDEPTVLRWEDVDEVYRSLDKARLKGVIDISVPWSCTLIGKDGESFNLKKLPGGRRHGDFIQERIFDHMFSRAVDKIERGEKVEFESLGASQQGLHGFGFDVIAWDEVQEMYIGGKTNKICVSKGGAAEKVLGGAKGASWGFTPNADVLFALCDYYTGRSRQAAPASA
jgi:hypothetical protein